jgi:UPF0176 protein
MAPVHRVAAFYGFADLDGLPRLKGELQALASGAGLLGTVLLAREGVNGTVSGPADGIDALLERLRALIGADKLRTRLSQAEDAPFHRLKVRLKREIVTMGCPGLRPAERVGTYVEPADWDALIRDPGTLLIDTRNSYEVAIGSFAGAIDPGTASFRSFPAWVKQHLRPLVAERRPRAIALFCTGGIRCEKATSYLLEQGFNGVHHLQGGILGYLEQRPEQGSLWQGECYVFDQRVALTHGLQPGSHSLCHACGLPLAPKDLQHPAYVEGVSCHHCLERFSDADRLRFAERQQQLQRARLRGRSHLGALMPAQAAADGR